jgi:hypothetical protein
MQYQEPGESFNVHNKEDTRDGFALINISIGTVSLATTAAQSSPDFA